MSVKLLPRIKCKWCDRRYHVFDDLEKHVKEKHASQYLTIKRRVRSETKEKYGRRGE